jgi:hypothetical protein
MCPHPLIYPLPLPGGQSKVSDWKTQWPVKENGDDWVTWELRPLICHLLSAYYMKFSCFLISLLIIYLFIYLFIATLGIEPRAPVHNKHSIA